MTVRQLLGIYPAQVINLTSGDAFDFTNGMSFVATGREILVMANLTGANATFTIPSTADHHGRQDQGFQGYTFLKNGWVVLGPWYPDGWRQADGTIWVDATGKVSYILLRTTGYSG
jgi:hypothetical protein